MPSVPTPPSQPSSKAGIISTATGERHIPSSIRADGSKRKEIKIRPGYKPPEDVEVYKNRTAETFRQAGTGPPPGSEGLISDGKAEGASANSDKNKKRREARKKAAAAASSEASSNVEKAADSRSTPTEAEPQLDPEAEREKKARNLKKKLKQAKDLKEKKEGGAALLPEQFAKVIKIQELIRELDALGFDAEGEPKRSKEIAER